MLIYILNIIIISFIALVINLVKQKGTTINTKKVFVVIITFQLILLQSLRHNSVGTDVLGYLRFYDYVGNLNISELFDQRMEFGFVLILKILSIFNVNHQLLLIVISILIHIPIGYVIYKYSKNEYISVISYITFGFYAASFCTLRQNIAYSIALLSLGSIKDRKLLKFLLLLTIATLIHKSAIVFLPSYYLVRIKYNKVTIPILLISIVALYFGRRSVAEFFINLFYDYYTIVSSNSYSWMLLSIMFLLLGIIFYKRFFLKYENVIYFNMISLSVMMMLFASVTTNAMRIANYFNIYLILYIPSVIESIRTRKNAALLVYTMLVVSIIIYIALLSRDSGYGYVPYKFFWQ